MTCLDLSPYYLHEARANLRRWARLRAPGLAMGGVDGNGAAFLQAAAEHVPQPDGSFDVVRARLRADLCRWHCRCRHRVSPATFLQTLHTRGSVKYARWPRAVLLA